MTFEFILVNFLSFAKLRGVRKVICLILEKVFCRYVSNKPKHIADTVVQIDISLSNDMKFLIGLSQQKLKTTGIFSIQKR